ncbi:MAG TPA: CRISPR-associated helicase Cas3' [Clostridiales bacterium]|nr:CRISPR-associated helicase Cas3' [Clostridiales bacterium]
MYNLLNVDNIINSVKIWAHTKKGQPAETLKEHSRLCLDYYNKYCVAKGIDSIVLKIISECGCNEIESKIVYDMFVNAIYLHDIGKINPYFQNRRLNNPEYKNQSTEYEGNSNHALPSAYIYMCEFMQLIEGERKRKLSLFLFSFAYCIAKHHGYLKNTDGFCDDVMYCQVESYYNKILNLKKNSIITTDKGYDKLKKYISSELAFNILCRLLFSVITACDYCATSEYKNGTKFEISIIENIDKFKSKYVNSNIYKGIMRYKEDKEYFNETPINALRSDMFLEAESQLKENLNGNIYYLEAPTGAGKTNISINLMLNMMKLHPKINNAFYIFPFNTLVEQTYDTLSKYFTKDIDMAVINSVTPIVIKNDKDSEEPDYNYSYLGRIFNNYPIVITSHVNFFNALFGCGREQVFPLIKLCNSIVIIDEIQSYKNNIWRHIISFLSMYSKLLNIKIIIMSATLPKLDKMLDTERVEFIDLIKNPDRYYQNPLFKDRVDIDLSLLEYEKTDLDVLADKVVQYKDKKVLVEFISKITARNFYNILKEQQDLNVVELTGDDNTRGRKNIIERIGNSDNIIVVATQVIEAGVDIDMDIGFKDISIPDADEQFLGRINRSCLKIGSKVYFFNYDDASKIYKGDLRISYPITNEEIAKMFQCKDFEGIYAKVLTDLKNKTDQLNRDNIKNIFKACLEMKFNEIEKAMRLIDSNIQLFVAHKMVVGNEIIDGRQVWKEFKDLCENDDMEYAEKKVNISLLSEKMSYFSFNIYNINNMQIRCDEEFAGYYYIENGECFIKDGKFDREEFSRAMKGMFL